MPRYLLLALNGPTAAAGDEDTYNRWYDEVHIPDLQAIPGVTSARRYKVLDNGRLPQAARHPYVAVYEIETDALDKVMAAMTTIRPFTPAFDRSTSAHILAVAIGPED